MPMSAVELVVTRGTGSGPFLVHQRRYSASNQNQCANRSVPAAGSGASPQGQLGAGPRAASTMDVARGGTTGGAGTDHGGGGVGPGLGSGAGCVVPVHGGGPGGGVGGSIGPAVRSGLAWAEVVVPHQPDGLSCRLPGCAG